MIALSTAYKEALIAIDIKGKKAYKTLQANCKHSENLLPALDEALQQIGMVLEDNDYYAVIIGPGSFTGLRISTALVKGLLAGQTKKNILPLTTFDLMAYSYIKNFSPKEDFACIINALSGKYFFCRYNYMGEKIGEEQMLLKEELDQIKVCQVSLEEEGLTSITLTPTPQEFLELACQKITKENLLSADELLPLYIRKSQAEDSLEEKEKK